MPFTQGNIAIKQLNEEMWELLEPVVYQGNTETFTVPTGFKTDLASVPRTFVWLLPRYGLYTKAAILHDYLGSMPEVNKADRDGLFRRTLRELGVPFARRWMMWAGVRLGSAFIDARLIDIVVWAMVAVPSIIFLFIPAIIVTVWLIAFWLIELVIFVILRPFSHKKVNLPHITLAVPVKK